LGTAAQLEAGSLLWSGDWSTFCAPDFRVTIAGVTLAKLVRKTHPVEGSTLRRPPR
jgi:hypothetical protein